MKYCNNDYKDEDISPSVNNVNNKAFLYGKMQNNRHYNQVLKTVHNIFVQFQTIFTCE